jgi:hypothetical protein
LPAGRRPHTRYLVEALEFFGEQIAAVGHIELTALALPSGNYITTVAVLFPELHSVLSLGASEEFTARGSAGLDHFAIGRLDGAIVSADGHVTLRDDERLAAVKLLLTPLPEKLSDLEEKIVWLIVMYRRALNCFRRVADEMPHIDPAWLPRLPVIDYGRVRQIRAPSFKEFLRFLGDHRVDLRVSRQKYSQTLIKCGMRQHRLSPATI